MKVDIWSDVMCPFCYIGKRKFEHALAQFANKERVEIEWHSFQLDPTVQSVPGTDIYSYLAERKGLSVEQSKQMHGNVVRMAADVGLQYNFDKAIIANSYDAHRVSQLAKKYGKGDEMEEQLFKGYFTEGKDISDHETLVAMAAATGMNGEEVRQMLAGNAYKDAVDADIERAAQIGINGVPFFVFNNRYAVSGAQQPETFLGALNAAWKEYEKENPTLTMIDGDAESCEIDGDCK
ncbi:MAG TPA: DsbA family oxidoreductase [Flavipsychrobacter sp.]